MAAGLGKAPDFSWLFGGAVDEMPFRTGNLGRQYREFGNAKQGISAALGSRQNSPASRRSRCRPNISRLRSERRQIAHKQSVQPLQGRMQSRVVPEPRANIQHRKVAELGGECLGHFFRGPIIPAALPDLRRTPDFAHDTCPWANIGKQLDPISDLAGQQTVAQAVQHSVEDLWLSEQLLVGLRTRAKHCVDYEPWSDRYERCLEPRKHAQRYRTALSGCKDGSACHLRQEIAKLKRRRRRNKYELADEMRPSRRQVDGRHRAKREPYDNARLCEFECVERCQKIRFKVAATAGESIHRANMSKPIFGCKCAQFCWASREPMAIHNTTVHRAFSLSQIAVSMRQFGCPDGARTAATGSQLHASPALSPTAGSRVNCRSLLPCS